jgi:hypothetical protein
LIKINSDAAVTICLGYPAFIKNKIGLKNIPPPIPTIPEKNPITDPINIETAFGTEFILISSSLYDLFLINKSIPAINKIINKIISNNSFEIDIEAPKNAKGIEPIKYGISKLRFRFPDLT